MIFQEHIGVLAATCMVRERLPLRTSAIDPPTVAKRRPQGFGWELCQLALTESRVKSRERDLNLHREIVLMMKANVTLRAYLTTKATSIAR